MKRFRTSRRAILGIFLTIVIGGGLATVQAAPTVTPTPTPAISPTSTGATPEATATVTETKSDAPPTEIIQRYTEELRKMIGIEERKSKVARDEKKEQEITAKVREFFDFQGLAELSLGKYWKKITQAQRDEFSNLFINLVEESYIRRSRDLVGNYKLTFNNERITGDKAKVTCRVARADADIDIVYELHRKDGKWMIFNIVLDNVDLILNYQSQFNSIIKKKGFKALIKLMKKKLDDEDTVEPGI
jgi:phospholipid transport system substrate-binding protein